jgi:hypothetical protein
MDISKLIFSYSVPVSTPVLTTPESGIDTESAYRRLSGLFSFYYKGEADRLTPPGPDFSASFSDNGFTIIITKQPGKTDAFAVMEVKGSAKRALKETYTEAALLSKYNNNPGLISGLARMKPIGGNSFTETATSILSDYYEQDIFSDKATRQAIVPKYIYTIVFKLLSIAPPENKTIAGLLKSVKYNDRPLVDANGLFYGDVTPQAIVDLPESVMSKADKREVIKYWKTFYQHAAANKSLYSDFYILACEIFGVEPYNKAQEDAMKNPEEKMLLLYLKNLMNRCDDYSWKADQALASLEPKVVAPVITVADVRAGFESRYTETYKALLAAAKKQGATEAIKTMAGQYIKNANDLDTFFATAGYKTDSQKIAGIRDLERKIKTLLGL